MVWTSHLLEWSSIFQVFSQVASLSKSVWSVFHHQSRLASQLLLLLFVIRRYFSDCSRALLNQLNHNHLNWAHLVNHHSPDSDLAQAAHNWLSGSQVCASWHLPTIEIYWPRVRWPLAGWKASSRAKRRHLASSASLASPPRRTARLSAGLSQAVRSAGRPVLHWLWRLAAGSAWGRKETNLVVCASHVTGSMWTTPSAEPLAVIPVFALWVSWSWSSSWSRS